MDASQSIQSGFALIAGRWYGPGRVVVRSANIFKHESAGITIAIRDDSVASNQRWRSQDWR
jgi:hypothetical protein